MNVKFDVNNSHQPKRVYQLTPKQLERLELEIQKKFIGHSFVLMLALPLMALRDIYGFGHVRLARFMDRVMAEYEAMCDKDDRLPLDAMINLIKEETGVDVIEWMPDRKTV